jgi:hypothetical protein
MPRLEDVRYDEAECIKAFSNYFIFLTAMYLDEDDIEWPPEDGWPFPDDTLKGFGKSDAMISLLHQLPYIRDRDDLNDTEKPQATPYSQFANWKDLAQSRQLYYGLHVLTEHHLWDSCTPNIVGLVIGGRNAETILLDIEYGVIYWVECIDALGDLEDNIRQEFIEREDWAWVPEKEGEWRQEYHTPAWTIPDFFEMLKDQFRNLRFIPANNRQVFETWQGYKEDEELPTTLRAIYREYGWPDLERYRKTECIKAVEEVIKNKFPDELTW